MPVRNLLIRDRALSSARAILGAILVAVPLAVWIAWSGTVLAAILAAGLLSATGLVLLYDLPRNGGNAAGASDRARKAELSASIVAELHRIYPLVYHNSWNGTPRSRRTMERIRRMIDSTDS